MTEDSTAILFSLQSELLLTQTYRAFDHVYFPFGFLSGKSIPE